MTKPQLYACLRFTDCDAGIAFVEALGFTERLVVRDPEQPGLIHHAQYQWRDTGGIMFGSDRPDGIGPAPGTGCINLVVASDAEVDAVLNRALAVGARQLSEITEPDHGGRSVAVADSEGNIWNIDSYPGE